ncbi:peptidoglycan DD-metalloendopeptidase family protein [Buchnera aphidicola]|uniref:peptidoglycan DD-metalloendopeptidase family protein n=1 Tax=Buchnera aphidicola TaxID=9 RepID=UPI003463B583
MQSNFLIYRLFFLIFTFFSYTNIASGNSIIKKNEKSFLNHLKKIKNTFYQDCLNDFFFKKNHFSSLKNNEKYFNKKNNFFIGNHNYMICFKKNIFHVFYIVKKRDTLFSLCKHFGYTCQKLYEFNNFKKSYKIFIGQKVWIANISIKNINLLRFIIFNEDKIKKKYISCKSFFEKSSNIAHLIKMNKFFKKIYFPLHNKLKEKNNIYLQKKNFFISDLWCLPVRNLNIKKLSNFKINDHQGFEISGFKGQSIYAVASGEVVFIDSSFKHYGRLIIIQHKNNYLSIYGCNESILVNEKDKVYKKQKIATMGSLNNRSFKLYFQIRYKGEPINPQVILPNTK